MLSSAKLTRLVMTTLEDAKAVDIVNINVKPLTTIADRMIICTGTSSRHVQAMADRVSTAAKQAGVQPVGMEGQREGDWILVDLGDVIVHIMLENSRKFYNLEKLWNPKG
jgi:ribosome-associated protein